MRHKRAIRFLICVGCLATACLAQAPGRAPKQTQHAAAGHVPTLTKLAKMVVGLEEQLESAIRSGNPALVEKMLTEDFEMRVSAAPGVPVPRSDWIHAALAGVDSQLPIQQIAVHDLGDRLIASYIRPRARSLQRDASRDVFFVDVWQRSDESWKLAIRYAGPSGPANFAIPGASVASPPIPKKY